MVATLVSPHVNIQDLTWLTLAGILIWDFQRPVVLWAILLIVMQIIFGALYALYVISPLHWYPSFAGVHALCFLVIALAWSIERRLVLLQPRSAVLTIL
jgi:NhaP-type Na+/H+ or K+/H+ antiporter